MKRQYRSIIRRAGPAIRSAASVITIFTLLAATSANADNEDAVSAMDHSPDAYHATDSVWINDVGTLLYSDRDNDGYFSGLSISIDADTDAYSREVYATIDIVGNAFGSTGATGLHTTRDFDIYGRSHTDEYRVEIDLLMNYNPGVYDLQVQLIDAHDGRILDSVGAGEFRNLRALPLESEDYDDTFIPVPDRPTNPPNDDVRVTEYAGSTGFFILGLLLLVLMPKLLLRSTVGIAQHH